MLGFTVVLAITAISMGIAYYGFERVSAGVSAYRKSVAEADLSRNIDRELISYRGLARFYMVTGKEDDAKAALSAEASLKDAIDQSMRGTTNPARLDQSPGWPASSRHSARFSPILPESSATAPW
jgi:hypothetical protein